MALKVAEFNKTKDLSELYDIHNITQLSGGMNQPGGGFK
jgi:hypothetical protein